MFVFNTLTNDMPKRQNNSLSPEFYTIVCPAGAEWDAQRQDQKNSSVIYEIVGTNLVENRSVRQVYIENNEIQSYVKGINKKTYATEADFADLIPHDRELRALIAARVSTLIDGRQEVRLQNTPSSQFNEVGERVIELPSHAPELYSERKVRHDLGRKENPIEFYDRVWKRYEGVLYQDDIKRLGDDKLVQSIRSFCSHNDLPVAEHLPPPRRARLEKIFQSLSPADPLHSAVKRKLALRQQVNRSRNRAR